MRHSPFAAVGVGVLLLLVSGVAYEAQAAQLSLVVRVTTDRHVYRVRRLVRITLAETNTSDHDEPVAIGCQILHGSVTHDGTTVWTFHDYRLCATGEGMLKPGASRTLGLFWNGRPNPGGSLESGVYVVHAGIDGVTGSATIRLRRRRDQTP
jgi:hypothetical protein